MSSHLLALKLRALVREHRGEDSLADLDITDIGIGIALSVGDDVWILAEERPERALGGSLAWWQRMGGTSLNIVAPSGTGLLSRRARMFVPEIGVWAIDDRRLVRATPEVFLPEADPRPAHLALLDVISESGADVVVEHGVVTGEVFGLEVCRVVDDAESGEARLEVGVGVHDREAFAMMHGETSVVESLVRIVDVVRGHRRQGADPHPLNRLATERALRQRVIAHPDTIGAGSLRAVSTPTPRTNVKDATPCAAIGETTEGDPLVVVFSTGIDLDVVPTAADTREWYGLADARLVIAVPGRDVAPVTQRLAAALIRPAAIVGL